MNVKAVSSFIRSKYGNLSDGVQLYEVDGEILFPIRNRNTQKADSYVMYFVKPPLGATFDPNADNTWRRFGVRVPDHSELGASRLGWQSRLKHLLDKELEKFREELKK